MNTCTFLKSFLFMFSMLLVMVVINILASGMHIFPRMAASRPVKTSQGQRSVSVSQEKKSNIETEKTNTTTLESRNRKDHCINCFRHDFKYVIPNTTLCNHKQNVTIDLIIVILTEHVHAKQRKGIRETWATIARGNSNNVRYVFLLGKTDDERLMNATVEENGVHGDLIMEDFKDTYSNLTYKTVMGLKWASLYCADARFFMKTDDDMWVNVPEVLKTLKANEKELQKSVGGYCLTVASPIRDPRSRWFASIRSYPHSTYPGFCSGTGYVSSLSVAKKLYEVSASVPFFHLEDVYVSLCVQKLGMTLRRLKGFHNSRVSLDPCQLRSSRILTSHEMFITIMHRAMSAKC